MNAIAAALGRVGLPAPISELAAKRWDVVVVGGGHNGLTCAAYLADYEVLGAPDIERKVGLTGGHIFQGEVRPEQMWEHRLSARTPIPGVYLCGAATHPAGSVIATNGRNAANAVLADAAMDPVSLVGG